MIFSQCLRCLLTFYRRLLSCIYYWRSQGSSDAGTDEHLVFFFQVNARDFSKVDHEETVVEAIRREPIVVQVLRRTPTRGAAAVAHNCSSTPQDVCVVDVCTQTDITFEHIMALAKLRPATPPVPDICPFLLSDR